MEALDAQLNELKKDNVQRLRQIQHNEVPFIDE